ncbi:hypothetical protein A3F65_01485 [Candidatus Saccharibacteria bacterium RIFCSPHIGHO2_12_FULL_47_16b]|nr:MAG: hypothetical protein A3F65_01485 [Candidatus Saccharibacteria bacterium RIFCSPHIGHO2_12_FULL_47_16b]
MTKRSVEERLVAIEARNARVEKNKAWETSLTRRLSIALLTYFVVVAYLLLIDNDRPYVTAIVPAVGYFLSTLVMRNIKSLWQGRRR